MLVGSAVILLVFLVALGLLGAGMRRWAMNDASTEARLHSPGTHTVIWDVPDGEDPVVAMAALKHAGFVAVVDTERRTERILVECEEEDRDRVRHVIERAHAGGDDRLVERVSFEDEG